MTIDGASLIGGPFGNRGLLTLTGDNVVIEGLNLQSSPQHGLALFGGNLSVKGCFIGTTLDGLSAAGNTLDGIFCDDCEASVELANLVSGNGRYGLHFDTSLSDDEDITGTLIGVDITAEGALGNGSHGVYIVNSRADQLDRIEVGDYSSDEPNVIGCNGGDGIHVEGNIEDIQVQNSFIGVSAQGDHIGNAGWGVWYSGDRNGSPNPGDDAKVHSNFIGFNTAGGVYIESYDDGWIANNGIGSDLSGTLA